MYRNATTIKLSRQQRQAIRKWYDSQEKENYTIDEDFKKESMRDRQHKTNNSKDIR